MYSETNAPKGMLFFNFLSILGLTLFAVFNFIGMLFFFDGTIGTSLLITLGLTLLLTALLILMCVAKAKDSHFALWRTVEFSALALFIIAAGASFFGPVRSLCIMGSKGDILAAARADRAAMDTLIAKYEAQEGEAITNTITGLKSSTGKLLRNTTLREWCKKNELLDSKGYVDDEYINNFKRNQKKVLLENDFPNIKTNTETLLDQHIGIIESWNIFQMPAQPAALTQLAEETAKQLTDLSNRADLPKIEWGDIVEENQTFTYDAPSMKVAQAISKVGYGKWYAWLILIIIHTLTLCSYFWTLRSRKTLIKEKAITNGSTIL